jgi:SAM-dependent MidA family methyltransferase
VIGLIGRIAAQARRFGPLPWSVFMEAALYDPEDGFYESGGGAGRRQDFVTSPELGPLFGATWARALDSRWEELGRPDPYVVVEAGAGTGTLARDVLAAEPECAPALRYVLVERSARLREAQAGRLPLELPAFVLGPSEPDRGDADDSSGRAVPGTGPMVTSLAELPALTFDGVIFANELLDNLPFDLVESRHGTWHEVRVAADTNTDGLVEVLVAATPDLAAEADRLVDGEAPEGARIPMQREAARWLRQALTLLDAGSVVLVDYADTTAGLARTPWPRWLRTFRQHQPGSSPLEDPGGQDITGVVAVDQLAAIRSPTSDQTQADWLAAHGIGDLRDDALRKWRERAAVGDLEAMRARSRTQEASALIDPHGLGAFRVLTWRVP